MFGNSRTKYIHIFPFQILFHIVPPELGDHNDIVLEITAGVGGQESQLFSKEIMDLYTAYAHYRGWEFTLLGYDETEIGIGPIPSVACQEIISLFPKN